MPAASFHSNCRPRWAPCVLRQSRRACHLCQRSVAWRWCRRWGCEGWACCWPMGFCEAQYKPKKPSICVGTRHTPTQRFVQQHLASCAIATEAVQFRTMQESPTLGQPCNKSFNDKGVRRGNMAQPKPIYVPQFQWNCSGFAGQHLVFCYAFCRSTYEQSALSFEQATRGL